MTVAVAESLSADELASMLGYSKLALAAFLEAMLIEKSYREAAEMTGGDWPAGRCAEASYDLYETLTLSLPQAGAEFVWGKFTLPGYRGWAHAWVALADETIIDITAGQFLPDQPKESTIMVLPDDRLTEAYVETERNPHWARPFGTEGGAIPR